MLEIKYIRAKIQDKRSANGSSLSDESLIVAIHMENEFGLAHSDATDQTSQSGDDHGIDGWNFCNKNILHVFQSKLTEDLKQIRTGLDDLLRGADWLHQVLIQKRLEKLPTNNALHNLYVKSAALREKIKIIKFVLLCPYEDEEQLSAGLGSTYIENLREGLSKHPLNKAYDLEFEIRPYVLKSKAIPRPPKKYPIKQFEESKLTYKGGTLSPVLSFSWTPREPKTCLAKGTVSPNSMARPSSAFKYRSLIVTSRCGLRMNLVS